MARLLEFNETEALTAAMRTFRRLGFAGVSIKTLEAETGLSSGSIYNSFGGKDEVFKRVLDHYNDVVVAKRIREHLDEAEPIAGLISLFQSLLEEPDDGAFGCLLTNSAIEFAGNDTIATKGINNGFDQFLSAFNATLMRIPHMTPNVADKMSLQLLIYYQGLLVLIRHGHDKTNLRNAIKTEINAITGNTNVK